MLWRFSPSLDQSRWLTELVWACRKKGRWPNQLIIAPKSEWILRKPRENRCEQDTASFLENEDEIFTLMTNWCVMMQTQSIETHFNAYSEVTCWALNKTETLVKQSFRNFLRPFRAWIASRQTVIRLFWKADLLTFLMWEKPRWLQSWMVRTLALRNKGNCGNRNRPEKFRDFWETGP